jgi:hypothetical protein
MPSLSDSFLKKLHRSLNCFCNSTKTLVLLCPTPTIAKLSAIDYYTTKRLIKG